MNYFFDRDVSINVIVQAAGMLICKDTALFFFQSSMFSGRNSYFSSIDERNDLNDSKERQGRSSTSFLNSHHLESMCLLSHWEQNSASNIMAAVSSQRLPEAYGPYALLHLRISTFRHPQRVNAVRNWTQSRYRKTLLIIFGIWKELCA